MEKDITLDRETYRQFKSMSREKMTSVLNSLYLKSKRDVLNSIKNVNIDTQKIRSEISTVSGIGKVRLNQIMEIIERNLRDRNNANE